MSRPRTCDDCWETDCLCDLPEDTPAPTDWPRYCDRHGYDAGTRCHDLDCPVPRPPQHETDASLVHMSTSVDTEDQR